MSLNGSDVRARFIKKFMYISRKNTRSEAILTLLLEVTAITSCVLASILILQHSLLAFVAFYPIAIAMIGMLAMQMRNLYAARLALENGLGANFLLESGAVKYDFQARKLVQAARGYTLERLIRAVELCAETDYRMKSSGGDSAALFQDAVLRIAAGECDA